MDATIHNSSNCSTFESPMEGDKADDVQGIHPAPVQADDTSNRTSAVPGHGLPLSDPSSSNAGKVNKTGTEETGVQGGPIMYVPSQGGDGKVEDQHQGGTKPKVTKVPKKLIGMLIGTLLSLALMILVLLVLTVTLGLASPGGNETQHNAYLGDTVALFSVTRWFWLESVLVKGEPALQDEQEVNLFSVACDSLKVYTTFSHIEPGHAFDVAAPFPILDHHLQDVSNYFATASGNITLNMTVWSKDLSKLTLCYFDRYEVYESFIQRSPNANEKALNCAEYQATAEPKTFVSDYVPTHPGYYFVAVAANSPFSLQYTVNLWHEEFNQSDYVAENCSIIGGASCEISLLPNYDLQPPEICILARYLTGPEDFIGLHAVTQHRFRNNRMLIAGCVILPVLIIIFLCISVIYCCYIIIRNKFGKSKKNIYVNLTSRNTEESDD